MAGGGADPTPDVSRLAWKIDEVLTPLLNVARRVALLDFPNHNNVGDSAIWLGERRFLRRGGVEVVYACDVRTYDRTIMRRTLGASGTILLHGGGNVGDLWPVHQRFRERVLDDFPAATIVQLPQTVRFADPSGVPAVRARMSRHERFTMLVRDAHSLDLAQHGLGLRAVLCPDLAFALAPPAEQARPKHDVVCLLRTDGESAGAHPPLPGAFVTDWIGGAPGGRRWPLPARAAFRLGWRYSRHYHGLRGALRHGSGAQPWFFDGLAAARLRRGYAILSSGRAVVSDRLHGHILCLLLGRPHVLLEERYGKLRAFHDAWTPTSPLTRWADDAAHAVQIARDMVTAR